MSAWSLSHLVIVSPICSRSRASVVENTFTPVKNGVAIRPVRLAAVRPEFQRLRRGAAFAAPFLGAPVLSPNVAQTSRISSFESVQEQLFARARIALHS